MGCLLLPFELIFDAIMDGWFFLMQLIVPENKFSKGLRIILKILVGAFTIILFVIMFLGVFAILSDDADTRQLGKWMILVPLGLSVIQIVAGIIVRFARKGK